MEQERAIHIDCEDNDVRRVHFTIEVSFALDAEGILSETTEAKVVVGARYGKVPVNALTTIQGVAEQVEERFSLGLVPDSVLVDTDLTKEEHSPVARIA